MSFYPDNLSLRWRFIEFLGMSNDVKSGKEPPASWEGILDPCSRPKDAGQGIALLGISLLRLCKGSLRIASSHSRDLVDFVQLPWFVGLISPQWHEESVSKVLIFYS